MEPPLLMEPVLAALARFVAETPEDRIPAETRAHARLVVADTLGAILGGSAEAEMARLLGTAERAAGAATVLAAGFPRAEPWWAVVANGTAGTALEQDEGNRYARGHPAIHVLPAALAEAERLGASGRAMMTALIVGYDVAARLGAAAPVRPGMHMHGVHGVVGAAAAVARLRGIPAAGTARALAVAAGLTLGTSWRTALGGATVRNAYAGVGGATGWLAVDLAQAGFAGLPDMLTESFGRISGSGVDAALALEALGERFELTRNYFKRHACCRLSHATLDALEALLGEGVEPARVEAVRVATDRASATMSDRDPAGSLGAKFSIPYAVAARLVLGHCGPEAFREPALSDPRVRALARRIEVAEDPDLSARLPAERPARVELRLAGGGVAIRQVDLASGEFDRPYPVALLQDKFVELTRSIFGESGASTAWVHCGRVDELADLTDLARILREIETRGARRWISA
jgi:2-methylcitrate dehydratase PrpD